jgi:hypothetical protein
MAVREMHRGRGQTLTFKSETKHGIYHGCQTSGDNRGMVRQGKNLGRGNVHIND